MTFEEKAAKRPEDSNSYAGRKDLIGTVVTDDLSRFSTICQENPPPAKQFNGPRPINPGKPLRRCQEWTSETIQALKDAGVLKA
ncbi:hypothetical protein FH972_025098 [Carpinus fangiana]|uniref:Uncharacterized protein n=1 Tax=Carpinus fangiana TaxID=176857 RepID=A0A5N6L0C7_9ROSI|nr:hypothetical protein FH972_025098 [Carpinus fangiana]